MQSAGERGEAEAIGIEIARLLRAGYAPDGIAIVLRHPASSGAAARLGAARPRRPGRARGRSLSRGHLRRRLADRALPCGASTRRRSKRCSRHLRLDPSLPPGVADSVERRLRRGDAQTVSAATEPWQSPPRHLGAPARGVDAAGGCARWRARPASSPRARTASRRRSRAPAPRRPECRSRRSSCGPASPPRSCCRSSPPSASSRAASSPTSRPRSRRSSRPRWLSGAGRRRAGCGSSSPYRARAARARALFCASLQDGEFPERRAAGPAALRGSPPGDRQSRPAPHRSGRGGALPVPLLRLAADRAAVPELAGLRRGRNGARPLAVRRRGARPARHRTRAPPSAPGPQARARARRARARRGDDASASSPGRWRSAAGPADREPVLERLGLAAERAPRSRRCSPGSRTRTPSRAR